MSTKAQQVKTEVETPGTNSELPEGWAATTMDALSTYITSGSRDWSEYYADSGALFIRTQDINQNKLAPDGIARVALPERVEGKRTLIAKGDLLITITGANVGKCAYVDRALPEAYVSQSVALVRLAEGFSGPFIHRQLISPSSDDERTLLQKSAYGVGRPVLNLDNVREIPILFAPLNEQLRIVAQVDELLSHVDSVRQRLAKSTAILKSFRKAVLAAACSGKLTEDWRQQNPRVEPTRKLLERTAVKSSKPKRSLRGTGNQDETYDLPTTWAWAIFDDTCTDITVGHVGPMIGEYVSSGVPFLRSQNVREFRFDPAGLKFVSRSFHQRLAKSALHPGDVAVVRSGYPGVSCVIPDTLPEANCADLVVVRPSGALNSHYACMFINSSFARNFVESEKVGIAQGHFNVGSMRKTPLPLPPLEEQEEIVHRVEALFNLADAIEKRVAAATTRAGHLMQAVLAKAFRGELVPTEAELAKREEREYEPASALLERIKAEREKASASCSSDRSKGRKAART